MRSTHNSSPVCCATLLLILLAWNVEAQTITTIAGTDPLGDGGPATSAQLAFPLGIGDDASGNLFIADAGNNRVRKVDLARPSITSPPPGAVLSRGSPMPVTLAWTVVPEAAQYGFEHTGAGLQFANPNGTGPDRINGFGGAGGAFVVPETSFTITLSASVPPGPYQVRVIGLSATGQPVGIFSDALTVTVQ